MEFLKAFFGDKAITYDELVQAINAYNGDEKNKEKLIKMVNLTDGGYVSKDKYTNLETDLSGKTTELTKANIDTGIGYHLRKANYYVSEKPRAGFRLHPAFYDASGNEIDYFLTSAYEGSIYDALLTVIRHLLIQNQRNKR